MKSRERAAGWSCLAIELLRRTEVQQRLPKVRLILKCRLSFIEELDGRGELLDRHAKLKLQICRTPFFEERACARQGNDHARLVTKVSLIGVLPRHALNLTKRCAGSTSDACRHRLELRLKRGRNDVHALRRNDAAGFLGGSRRRHEKVLEQQQGEKGD